MPEPMPEPNARQATHAALVFKKFSFSGGAEQMAGLLVSAFQSVGIRLSIIARDAPEQMQGIDFVRCNPKQIGRSRRAAGFARAVNRIREQIAPDWLFTQEPVPGCDVYRPAGGVHAEYLAQKRRAQTPLARAYSYLQRYHRQRLILEREVYEHPGLRAVLCNSGMVREDILRHYRIARERLVVVENAINIEYFQRPDDAPQNTRRLRERLGIPASALLLVFVGSGFERKGLAVALRALAASASGAHLVVVGRDKRQGSYQRLAGRLKVRAQVHFVGPQSDVRPYYWAAQALIHPAYYEAYGLVILEAMASGLPVLTSTQCGGGQALVQHGRNGYLHDAQDIAGFASAIASLGDKARRRAMSVAAQASAAPHDLARYRRDLARFVREFGLG